MTAVAEPFTAFTTPEPADPYLVFLDLADLYHHEGSTPRNAGRRAMDRMQARGYDAVTVLDWFQRYTLDTL
ncbi:hypothetical protein AB0383_20440 [Amycolatopsis sp. NPDC051373]|uniref:hypothetical protein n=1 Tax=Amycolatopsis sp. NPDC051373 TaxID=3155801 RepID=UPI003450217A